MELTSSLGTLLAPSTGADITSSGSAKAQAWQRRLSRTALVGDVTLASLGSLLIEGAVLTRLLMTMVVLILWPLAVWSARGYEPKFLGVGSEEFRRVFGAGLALLSTVAVAAVLLDWPGGRRAVLLLLVVTSAALFWRYALRRWLHERRMKGVDMHRVLLVGHASPVNQLSQVLSRDTYHGLQVVGACVPAGTAPAEETSLAILGTFSDVDRAVAASNADTVAVLSCPELDGPALRRLVWSLEPANVDLLVAPAAIEIAGPRLSVRPAAGLPLLHLEAPELRGGRRVLKAAGDRVVSALALLFLAPILFSIGLIVRLDSPGPAVFRQRRVGLDGREFDMLKFRSMIIDAEQHRAEIAHLDVHGTGQLFKVKADPRVTRVGRLMRRYSIDELPQLFNVLRGEMSLVGPRPPLPAEVAAYGVVALPRLRVKPGLTGLWQVSGRSDLSVEESVRLDLRYVENWSLAMDAMILWKTGRAVLGKSGAY